MKILHLATDFFPKTLGGKEVIIYNLVKNLTTCEHRVAIHEGSVRRSYLHDDICVEVLPMPLSDNPRASYFSLTFDSVPGFEDLLKEFAPDIVHFHDFCSGASLSHLRICKRLAIGTIVTYHSPGSSCVQKALIRKGQTPCDGEIRMTRCTDCRYQVRGVPAPASAIFSRIAPPFDRSGKLFFRNSTRLFRDSWMEFFGDIDAIHVYGEWLKPLMLLNGIDESKIYFANLASNFDQITPKAHDTSRRLRIGFAGRCTSIKGLHWLIDAIKSIPREIPMEIHFLGPNWDGTSYGNEMMRKIGHDDRFMKPRRVPPSAIVETLSELDVAIIPSVWPETGPLAVFDAFAARLPVIGTNLAGIAERVRDGVDGLLFKWGDVADLRQKIIIVLENREFLEQLRGNIRPQKMAQEFSLDLLHIYQAISNPQQPV
jgi:glycosyltransferase involved in cell wall biosynthesis